MIMYACNIVLIGGKWKHHAAYLVLKLREFEI